MKQTQKNQSEIKSYADIFLNTELNGDDIAYVQEGKNKTPISVYLKQREKQFPDIAFEGDQAYILRERLPQNIQELAFTDIKEISDVPYINLTEAIKIAQDQPLQSPQGVQGSKDLDLEQISELAIEESVDKKTHGVVGRRLTEDGSAYIITKDKKEYQEIKKGLVKFSGICLEAAIVTDIASKLDNKETSPQGERFLPAKIGEVRYGKTEKFEKIFIENYGKCRSLNLDEVLDLILSPEKSQLRIDFVNSLDKSDRIEALEFFGMFIEGQAQAQAQYCLNLAGDALNKKIKEKMKLEGRMAKEHVKDDKSKIALMVKIAENDGEINELKIREKMTRKGKRYMSAEELSKVKMSQATGGQTLSEMEIKPENDDVEKLTGRNEEELAIGLLGTTALIKLGDNYLTKVGDGKGGEIVISTTASQNRLHGIFKAITDEMFEKIYNLKGLTTRETEGFRTPTTDEDIELKMAFPQIIADTIKLAKKENLDKLSDYTTEEFLDVAVKEPKKGRNSMDKLKALNKLRKQAGIYESGAYGKPANISVEEFDAQVAAKKSTDTEEDDLSEFSEEVRDKLSERQNNAIDILKQAKKKKKS